MAFVQSHGNILQLATNQLIAFRNNRQPKVVNFGPNVPSKLTQLAFRSAFAGLPKNELTKIINESAPIFRKILRNKNIVVALDSNTNLCINPSASCMYIQRRGFRTQRFQPGKTDEPSVAGKPLGNIFNFAREAKEKSLEEQALNKYDLIKKDADKLPEPHRKPHMDGVVKGLLVSQQQTAAPKKPSAGTRIGNFLFWTITLYILIQLLWGLKIRFNGKTIFSLLPDSKEFAPEVTTVTFDDVRGMDEAKLEVEEIVHYLRDPEKYSRLGGRLPKGVLLIGPPGTGKTLLARAIAGEADVPFYHASGSEFDEILVGQGAKRVRELFERAKANAPCIIFIDEIDSVGSKRTSSSLHPYANQTINQLLSEMDGFSQNEGVIVIGATNRKEDLDKALLRPGRFDVQVNVPVPDFVGRKDIFKLYLDKIIHENINVTALAKGTTGFTGADIENMVNQAALKAATEGANRVAMRHLDDARDRILMGPARLKGRIPDEVTNKNTSNHEAGHTIVAIYTPDAEPIHKVTIIPRGQSLGHTAFLPEKDSYQQTKAQLLAKIDVAMGGRVAEELTLGAEKITTGASNDLRYASRLAETLVKQFGMSDRGGLRDYTASFETNGIVAVNEYGPQTSEALDQEINRILLESYNRAKAILVKYKEEHQLLAEALFERETLSAKEVHAVIKREKLDDRVYQPPRQSPFSGRKKLAGKPPMVHVHIEE